MYLLGRAKLSRITSFQRIHYEKTNEDSASFRNCMSPRPSEPTAALGRFPKGFSTLRIKSRLFKQSFTQAAVQLIFRPPDLFYSTWVVSRNKCFSSLRLLMCFHETVYVKWCLDKSVGRTENGLQHGFVKHQLNSVLIAGPKEFTFFCFASYNKKLNSRSTRNSSWRIN